MGSGRAGRRATTQCPVRPTSAAHLFSHLLIKAAQDGPAHHNGRIVAEVCQKSRALECDVSPADEERPSGRLLEPEEVVTAPG